MVSNQNPKSNRQRFLNVIYFVDSNRTQTFKFSLGMSYAILGALITTILWSLISTVLLINSYSHTSNQSDKIRSLLSTIFNYQTRYDGVYEKSYPSGDMPKKLPELDDYKTKGQPIADSKSKTNETEETVSLAAKASKPTPKAVPKAEVKPEAKTNPNQPTRTHPDKTEGNYIKINRYNLQKRRNGVNLTVSIRNMIRPERATGYIVGYARFISLDGKTHIISSPGGFTEDQTIKRLDLPRSHRFSIKYYTKKSLVFNLPNKMGGTFESIKIFVHRNPSEKLEFMYNVKGSKGTFAPSAQPTTKKRSKATETKTPKIKSVTGDQTKSGTTPEPAE